MVRTVPPIPWFGASVGVATPTIFCYRGVTPGLETTTSWWRRPVSWPRAPSDKVAFETQSHSVVPSAKARRCGLHQTLEKRAHAHANVLLSLRRDSSPRMSYPRRSVPVPS